uniref:Astacin domain-containing protein n=1 Tax=Angiostrongylus cantonensis TaxID=6313 RepID=A0A0K0DKM7_ANGCA
MFVDFVHALFSEASTEVQSQTTENEAALSAHPHGSMPEPDDQHLFWNSRGTCENIADLFQAGQLVAVRQAARVVVPPSSPWIVSCPVGCAHRCHFHNSDRSMLVYVQFVVAVRCITALGVVRIPNVNAKLVKDRFDGTLDIPSEELLDSVQNLRLLEGDIVGMPNVDESTLRRFRDDPAIDEEAVFSRPYYSALNLITYPEKLWTNGQIPYVLEEGMTTDQRAAIAQAFDEYKQKTCIRFVPRENDDDYIYIRRNVAFGYALFFSIIREYNKDVLLLYLLYLLCQYSCEYRYYSHYYYYYYYYYFL